MQSAAFLERVNCRGDGEGFGVWWPIILEPPMARLLEIDDVERTARPPRRPGPGT
ncbi:MAG: hypothetical protein GVY13_14740 [Alphaproteobacteria bacterium]|jgi:hypothetical protein|nr:hypothetical protein [Alphaproteobacteria bacterium]